MATAPIQWVPEDDLLLKNAVEAGASLEALAKGAVQFSRKFTFQELRDRWHALLYDPDVSAEASARMFELEISGINPFTKFNRPEYNLKGNKEVFQKRKAETIRRKYYAMRKKFRSELFSNSDLAFFEPTPHEFSGPGAGNHKGPTIGGKTLAQNSMLGDNISDHLGLQEEDLDILRHAFPETMRDMDVPSASTGVPQAGCVNSYEENCPSGIIRGYENVSTSLRQCGNTASEANKTSVAMKSSSMNENLQVSSVGFDGTQQFTSTNSDGFASFQMFDRENSSATFTGEFADPDSLLNLSNEDDILLIDLDDKLTEDKSVIGNINSVVTDSPKDIQENDVVKVEEVETMPVSETNSVHTSSSNVGLLEVTASSNQEDRQVNLHSEANSSSKPISSNDFAELTDGKIICTLNTEDPEIPCNDDIFLLIHPSTSFGSSAMHPNTTVSMDMSATSHGKINQPVANLQTNLNDSMRPSIKPGFQGLPESHLGRQLPAKTEIPQPVVIFNKTMGDSSKGKSLTPIPKLNDGLIEKDIAGVPTRVRDSSATDCEILRSTEVDPGGIAPPDPLADSSVSDEDESAFGDDAPYFSDIEAMILEMDLEPHDQDSQVIRQVPSYQYDDTKRTIIRLEQAARSCLERAMTSQGALAILYGRHLRHYIRKPEVLLGRSTDDVDVDIDLRKEGRANKISRRQAIIKMEADGSFFLKNLGKSSVSVNGVTVATGQLLALTPSCLIEIRGMSFVFEINQRYVRKHLGNFCLKNTGKTGKSDWSPDNK